MKFLLTLSPLYITAVAKKRILEIPLLLNLIFVNNKIPNIIREGFLNGPCQGVRVTHIEIKVDNPDTLEISTPLCPVQNKKNLILQN